VTVVISMDDRAILGNSTDRSREAKIRSKWSFLLDLLPSLGGPPGSQTKQTGA
jgi:flagellar L-ring protein FlgH